jgi:predicted N-acyltransferase
MSDVQIRMIQRLNEVERESWDQIANPDGVAYDPFISWDFLDALETSGCVSEETGWGPRHLIAEDEGGALIGAMPLYLKGHSYGEYVFDHAWANALERAGGAYYPKLLTSVPFTPATGRRLLAASPEIRKALLAAGEYAGSEMGVSSWHLLFPDTKQLGEMVETGLLKRQDIQFIFDNENYRDYADFLGALSSRKRKALKKEREVAQSGLEIEALSGADITEHHWDVFFACYQDTGARKWGSPYLNREFFSILHERMADRVLLVMAKRDGEYVASALNMIGSEVLFGRYWGCLEDHHNLHFELCYHQAIDYAIKNSLKRVEAGAQGAHKLARGYRPQLVYSAHKIFHPGLSDAIERYLRQEAPAVEAERLALEADSPYKKA